MLTYRRISSNIDGILCQAGLFPYVINLGDTLGGIAKRFNTTVSSLIAANPGINSYNLQIGQIICIAPPEVEKFFCPSENYYVVKHQDSLHSIAKYFNVTVEELIKENGRINPYKLKIGQVICIPLVASQERIIINVLGKKLTLTRKGIVQKVYSVATGKLKTPTPLGIFTIVSKQVNPGGPYGTRWMGLSKRGYGIHGTNNPSSIGNYASNGCIRMYNGNVDELFNLVSIGTFVEIF